jgi:mannose-6-phosphate isomerase-like protein (cupin superfamily)
MLVRRLTDSPLDEWHGLRTRILMDAGELGSRHLSVTWLEVPAGVSQTLHSHEESEQVYVVVRGSGKMSVAGDTETLAVGDLVLVPPATDHAIENDGTEDLCCVSAQSPAVSVDELHSRQLATEVAGLDDDDL